MLNANDTKSGFDLCTARLEHRAHRAILRFREMDAALQRFFRNIHAGYDVVHSYGGKYVWWFGPLVGLDAHLVAGDVLPLLAQDVDHVKGSAAGQSNCDQFNGFRAGIAGRVVEKEVVPAIVAGDELPMIVLRLVQSNATRNHVRLPT